MFRTAFQKKYFLEDVYGKKGIEFFDLKQVNSGVAEYAIRFEELVKFCPYYNSAEAEGSIKFENGLHSKIKLGINYQEIRQFPMLVNKCKIFDEDNIAKSSYYKSINENKGNG